MEKAPDAAADDVLYQEALDAICGLIDEARSAGDREPTAMTLATSDATRLSARIVLCKGIDARGLRFFTNYESDKAGQLAANPRAALCFHWKTLRDGVQVRVEGFVSKIDAVESDAYFATRPRGSQIGAWASAQSRSLTDRAEFEARIASIEQRFADQTVPRPAHWGGYLLAPERIELWYGAAFRLHERHCYENHDGHWTKRLLFP